jgi:hypothetical protein
MHWSMLLLRGRLWNLYHGMPAWVWCSNDGHVHSAKSRMRYNLPCNGGIDVIEQPTISPFVPLVRRSVYYLRWRMWKPWRHDASLCNLCGGMSPLCKNLPQYNRRNAEKNGR